MPSSVEALLAEMVERAGGETAGERLALRKHADALGVPALVEENERLREVLLDLVEVAEWARGHYGIEECAGPGQPATNWDDIQDELRRLARQGRAALASDSNTPTPNGGGDGAG